MSTAAVHPSVMPTVAAVESPGAGPPAPVECDCGPCSLEPSSAPPIAGVGVDPLVSTSSLVLALTVAAGSSVLSYGASEVA